MAQPAGSVGAATNGGMCDSSTTPAAPRRADATLLGLAVVGRAVWCAAAPLGSSLGPTDSESRVAFRLSYEMGCLHGSHGGRGMLQPTPTTMKLKSVAR